jgi:hypothetical protein
MAYYLAYNDEDGTFAKLHYELGNCMYKCGANPPDPPEPPAQQSYVKITTPENGAKIPATQNVTVTVEAWDDSGIKSISLFLKDLRQDSKYESQGTKTQGYVWNVGKLTFGTWVIRAAANTGDGDKLTTEFAIDVLDIPPPNVSIQSPADGAKIPSGQDVIVTVDASHEVSGINSVNLFLDGEEQGILYQEPYTWNLGNLSDGLHELKAEAISKDEQSATATINIQYGTQTSYTPTIRTTVNVYPNPANNFIHIQGADLNSNYEIYSILGIKLQSGNFGKTIDISDLNPGVYLLFVENTASRIVKE